MLFMPPRGVVMVLQPVGMRENFAAMAAACGHYAIPFFVACAPDVLRGTRFHGTSARFCVEDVHCKNMFIDGCHPYLEFESFLPTFRAAFSYAFRFDSLAQVAIS